MDDARDDAIPDILLIRMVRNDGPDGFKWSLILGVVGTLLGLLGIAMTYGKGMGPDWYPVALAVLAVPQSWLGGYLYCFRLKA